MIQVHTAVSAASLLIFLSSVFAGGKDVCTVPTEHCPCPNVTGKWYYNDTAKSCIVTSSEKCGDPGNEYDTETECYQSCQSQEEICSSPIVVGPCYGYFPRYAYVSQNDSCVRFIYGGCQGNGNRFETQKECCKFCKH